MPSRMGRYNLAAQFSTHIQSLPGFILDSSWQGKTVKQIFPHCHPITNPFRSKQNQLPSKTRKTRNLQTSLLTWFMDTLNPATGCHSTRIGRFSFTG